jgi:hypothetical protein
MSAFPFRFLVAILVGCLGAIASVNLVATLLSIGAPNFPEAAGPPAPGRVDRACLAETISFERTDLKTVCALMRTDQALVSAPQSSERIEAQASVVRAVQNAPYDSRLWLALATLKSQVHQPTVSALKMSYLTGSNAVEMIPSRLQTVAADDAVNDADLRQLAAGDIRLIVTKRPDLKWAVLDAYRHASVVGKQFIEEKLSDFDPNLVSSFGLK